jgi:hypothetical protein
MIIKMFWENCCEFVVEEEDAYLFEASAEEAIGRILPLLSPQEQLKFNQMKDVYGVKSSEIIPGDSRYYFLVSRDAHTIKFESVALLTADLSARGGKAKLLPDIRISAIEDIDSIDPTKY